MQIKSMNKAIAMVVLAVAYILVNLGIIPEGIVTEEKVELVIMLISPFVVYFIPNKKKVAGESINVNKIDSVADPKKVDAVVADK